MNKLFFIIIALLISSMELTAQSLSTDYVNPFVGTAEHGHTFPGAIVPFGAVQVSPDTRLTGWDGCSAYHYSDSVIYGFSHTHLSGTGCSDYGDILIMPFTQTGSPINTKYASSFSHQNETANPGYYSVILNQYGVKAELTATQHVGCHRYTFPDEAQPKGIVIDLNHRDETIESFIQTVNNQEFKGYRISKAWNPEQHIYFSLLMSEPVKKIEYYRNDTHMRTVDNIEGENCKAILYFDESVTEVVLKIAISAVDMEGASRNQSEIDDFNFDQVHQRARNLWNDELGKITVSTSDNDAKKIFYTALYHCFTAPYQYSDVDGRYRGMDGKTHTSDGKIVYTVFSLWDTYRALHPLLSIIDRERTGDFIHTFLLNYRQGGQLPMWELSAYETWCMIGYHSVPVILDAYLKGINDYNHTEMLQAMVASAHLPQLGRPEFEQYGFIPADKEHESVSKTLEYAYDDWCIAEFALAGRDMRTADKFYRRAQSYKNIMDSNGFMHPKSNGGFIEPFVPSEVNNHYTEANSWQYSTYVPHDFTHYMALMGGKEKTEEFLDSLFYGNSKLSGRTQSDITGVIGQYAHGNEPSHHAAYLYNFIGKPWKTQRITRHIMQNLYSSQPDGLCGNEDCGQMSAWYVLSAMGFYPVTPGNNTYIIGSPLFDTVSLHLENGKTFQIICHQQAKKHPYIQSAKYQGNPYNYSYITYDMIKEGGILELTMGERPNQNLWNKPENCPHTEIPETVAMSPVFFPNTSSFRDSLRVSLSITHPTHSPNSIIYYQTSQDSFTQTHRYTSPLLITESTQFKAFNQDNNGISQWVEANYYRFEQDKNIRILSQYNPQYTAGGDEGLIDHIRGNTNFRLGGWQGYQDTDFEAIIDLKSIKHIQSVSVGFLEEIRSWIWFPTKMIVEISTDGERYMPYGTILNSHPDNDYTTKTEDFNIIQEADCQYIRIKAVNYGTIPDWHLGAGGKAFIFVDEILVGFDKK
ncbi:MAG TPA: GH92 family glycosyl hydrolase [Bacteroidales bacterium]|nr:GH92 family glycosyl hydrolase [Bacteroidales bacterium]